MRASLIWLLVGATSVAACVVGSVGCPATAQDSTQSRSTTVSEETVKDVEVMRRVRVREGLATRSSVTSAENRALDFYVSTAWGGGGLYGSASEAFVVPGQGATVVLRTSDSVAPSKGSDDEAAAGAEKPSAWDEEAAALDGKPVATRSHRRSNKYEAAKVEALRARLLDVLAKYGQKIRGLVASDRITVIVVGGGGNGGVTVYEPQASAAANDAAATTLRATLVGTRTGADGRTVLVISASIADCQAAAGGSMSAEEFKRRTVVTAY